MTKDIVTEKSVAFLESVFDSIKHTPRHAYPISMLPYPKEVMKKAIKKYILALGAEKADGSLESALELRVAKGLYLSLADFRDEEDSVAAEKEREEMNKEINTAIPSFTSINLLAFA